MKKTLTFFALLICGGGLRAQQTINQVLKLYSNGINSTEILLNKEDNASYNSISSNSSGFGIYNSTTNKHILYANAIDFVGIGTVNPLAKLHVNGVIRAMHNISLDNSGDFENSSATGYGLYSLGGGGSQNLYPFKFDNYQGSIVMMADGGGNVGVGTNNPNAKLTIGGAVLGYPSLMIRNDSYSGSNQAGTASLQFSFTNHLGPKLEAYKVTHNTTGLKFYTEYGYSTPQLGMVIQPTSDGPLVGIGTTTPKEKLSVNGKIRAHEVKVETANWPDYVFEEGYKPKTLTEIEKFIKTNKHLPEVPSAKEVEQNGVELGEMNKILLKKIEELTLHMIALKKENTEINGRLRILEKVKNKN